MGLPVDHLDEDRTVETVMAALRSKRGGCLFTANLQHLRAFTVGNDADVYRSSAALPVARLVVADGMPLIWASKLRGTPLPERVAGSNLIFSLTRAAARESRSIFLLGGNPGAAEAAADCMRDENPSLSIAGLMAPPHGFERDERAIDEIALRLEAAAPDIVYLALGFPKQERLALRLAGRMPNTWFVGVGISFSFVCGEVRRAPKWMQRAGLEWMHRLVQEPRRLFRRYVLEGIPFAARMLAAAASARLGGRA